MKLWDKAIQHDEESDQGLAREIFASEKTAPLALSFGQGVYLTLLAQAAVAIVDPFPLPDVVAIPVILLSPIAVGTAGAAGTYFGLRAFPDYRGARLDLWRSSFLLGAANSLFTAQIVAANDDLYTTDESQMLVPLLIGLSSSATVVAGLGASLVAPLENPATGSAALTAGLTLGALTPILAAAAGVSFDAVALSWLLAGVVNAGYVGGAALAQWLPVKRTDAWFWTFGAALGGYSAFALAVTNQAPNPAIGWGTTAFGVLAGGSVAVALSRWLFPIGPPKGPTASLPCFLGATPFKSVALTKPLVACSYSLHFEGCLWFDLRNLYRKRGTRWESAQATTNDSPTT